MTTKSKSTKSFSKSFSKLKTTKSLTKSFLRKRIKKDMERIWGKKFRSNAKCYFCKIKIKDHKPNQLKWHLLMVSAYTDKLRTIYSRPDMIKAITKVQLARLKASRIRSMIKAQARRK